MAISREIIISRFVKQHGNTYDYSSVVFKNAVTSVTIICMKHGPFDQYIYNHAKGVGCPVCAVDVRREKRLSTESHISSRVKELFGEKYPYDLSTLKRLDNGRIQLLCSEHGEFTVSLSNIYGGKGCPKCGEISRGHYKNSDRSVISRKIADARIEKRRNAIVRLAKEIHGDRYDYDTDTYKNAKSKMRIVCRQHGEFFQTAGHHLDRKQGCPACANTCSKGESELFDFVLSLGVEAEKRNRKIIPPYELDVFIPSRNIAIEYHGLHWHADDMGGTSLKTKWQLCQEKGIRLIQIFEDEWLTRRHVVEDLLRASLGLREVKNARTLTTKIITKEEAKSFLEQWHIAGYARSELHFALCDESNIVSVLTTAKPRFGNEDLEIVRFASSCHVRGGFRKLFSWVLETTDPQSVVSFADLRFGTGHTYVDAGFNDMGITQADYWWFKGQERLTRYKTQKHRLKVDKRFSEFYKDDSTEREICTAAGYRKITGIGHRKFIWNRS